MEALETIDKQLQLLDGRITLGVQEVSNMLLDVRLALMGNERTNESESDGKLQEGTPAVVGVGEGPG
jgi:hypothetical protein